MGRSQDDILDFRFIGAMAEYCWKKGCIETRHNLQNENAALRKERRMAIEIADKITAQYIKLRILAESVLSAADENCDHSEEIENLRGFMHGDPEVNNED
jgi:hypothetical protein